MVFSSLWYPWAENSGAGRLIIGYLYYNSGVSFGVYEDDKSRFLLYVEYFYLP